MPRLKPYPPISRRGLDVMGYKRAKGLAPYTDPMIRAAKRLAKAAGYQWNCVTTDPLVTGKRFLEQARIVAESIAAEPPQTPKAAEAEAPAATESE